MVLEQSWWDTCCQSYINMHKSLVQGDENMNIYFTYQSLYKLATDLHISQVHSYQEDSYYRYVCVVHGCLAWEHHYSQHLLKAFTS